MKIIYLTDNLLSMSIRLMVMAALVKVAYNYFKLTYYAEIKKAKSFVGGLVNKIKNAVKRRTIKSVAFEVI